MVFHQSEPPVLASKFLQNRNWTHSIRKGCLLKPAYAAAAPQRCQQQKSYGQQHGQASEKIVFHGRHLSFSHCNFYCSSLCCHHTRKKEVLSREKSGKRIRLTESTLENKRLLCRLTAFLYRHRLLDQCLPLSSLFDLCFTGDGGFRPCQGRRFSHKSGIPREKTQGMPGSSFMDHFQMPAVHSSFPTTVGRLVAWLLTLTRRSTHNWSPEKRSVRKSQKAISG